MANGKKVKPFNKYVQKIFSRWLGINLIPFFINIDFSQGKTPFSKATAELKRYHSILGFFTAYKPKKNNSALSAGKIKADKEFRLVHLINPGSLLMWGLSLLKYTFQDWAQDKFGNTLRGKILRWLPEVVGAVFSIPFSLIKIVFSVPIGFAIIAGVWAKANPKKAFLGAVFIANLVVLCLFPPAGAGGFFTGLAVKLGIAASVIQGVTTATTFISTLAASSNVLIHAAVSAGLILGGAVAGLSIVALISEFIVVFTQKVKSLFSKDGDSNSPIKETSDDNTRQPSENLDSPNPQPTATACQGQRTVSTEGVADGKAATAATPPTPKRILERTTSVGYFSHTAPTRQNEVKEKTIGGVFENDKTTSFSNN